MQKAKNEHLLPVEIWRIYPYPDVTPPESFLVVLKGEEGKFVPISIGCPEGQYLVMAMQQVSFPRPLTHNLLQNLIDRVKGKVHQLVIHTLKEETFHAYLLIQTQDEVFYLDCRPSDGMILATLMKVPIFMSPEVMEEAGRELSGMLNIAELGEELGAADGAVSDQGDVLQDTDEVVPGEGRDESGMEPDIVEPGTEPSTESGDEFQALVELQMSEDTLLPASNLSGSPDAVAPVNELDALRAQLDRLVAEEAYEEAARIRDQISRIEETGSTE